MPEQGLQGFPVPNQTSFIPSGVVLQYAGATPPSGWLLCDGSAISRNAYAALFAAIGTVHGAGDGLTTFNLPDLRGRVPVGAGSGSGLTTRALGSTGGEESHTLSTAELPAHSHGISDPTHTHALTDPGHNHTQNAHNHGVTDPGHTHAQSTSASNVLASGSNFLSPTGTTPGVGTQSATTGISTNNATPTNNSATIGIPTTNAGLTGVTTTNTGSGNSHNVMQPFVTLNHIIKV